MNNNITIREATPSDSELIATVVCMAVGYDTTHPIYPVFEELARRDVSQYSWRNTLIAEVDGVTAGALVGYDGALLTTLREPIYPLLERHLGSTLNIEDETEVGEFYLDSVGVLPEYRGRGVASRLFEAQCERASALGHKVAGLIVDVDKPKAEALYARLGFVYLDDKDFFSHRMKHMVRQLNMTGQYYRHFKGNIYRVLHIAKHSETLEEMVVYQAMYGERGVWVRPKSMFEEVIERDGKVFRRFSPISAEEAEKIINNL